ncbi:MAG: peptidylprolyl isomerase [Planctomycetota bacterium]
MNITAIVRSHIAAISCLLLLCASASAQLVPERTYYGVERPIPMSIMAPEGLDGEVKLTLFTADGEVFADAAAEVGDIDLNTLFPELAFEESPPELLYAQLSVGDTKVGPPVVLQPMLSVRYATQVVRTPRGDRQPNFPPASPRTQRFSGIRAYVEKHVVFETTKGDMTFKLRPDEAPNTAFNFRHLVESGYYTDILFHRIIGPKPDKAGFVIQVGDPTGRGDGGPGYFVDLEPSTLPHAYGVLSMARTNDVNTNGGQVFVCLSREGTSFLDGLYTSFGEAIGGGDAIDAIASVRTTGDPANRPVDESEPRIVRAYLVDADSFGEGAEPLSKQRDAVTR